MLLLGPESSGKTVFMKRLKDYVNNPDTFGNADIPTTQPTVGTNITTLNIGKKETVEIRELGGTMAPIWNKYYKDTSYIMFMADVTNPQQLSTAITLLYDILTNSELKDKPILLLWHKSDNEELSMTNGELETVLDMEAVKKYASQKISTLRCSSITGLGFNSILTWLKQHVH